MAIAIGAFAAQAISLFNAQASGLAAQRSIDTAAMRLSPLHFQANPALANPTTAPKQPTFSATAPVGATAATQGMSSTTIAAAAGGVALLAVIGLVVLKKKKR
jgi:LPXTG-motif cell wall-anchored protein